MMEKRPKRIGRSSLMTIDDSFRLNKGESKMKKNRYLAILAASVLAASQITTAVFAASEINGSVHVNGDEAWAGNSEGYPRICNSLSYEYHFRY